MKRGLLGRLLGCTAWRKSRERSRGVLFVVVEFGMVAAIVLLGRSTLCFCILCSTARPLIGDFLPSSETVHPMEFLDCFVAIQVSSCSMSKLRI